MTVLGLKFHLTKFLCFVKKIYIPVFLSQIRFVPLLLEIFALLLEVFALLLPIFSHLFLINWTEINQSQERSA